MCSKGRRYSLSTQVPYSISTPGGQVVANQMARKIPLEIVG
jgi:hypothetical protein